MYDAADAAAAARIKAVIAANDQGAGKSGSAARGSAASSVARDTTASPIVRDTAASPIAHTATKSSPETL
jgi:hypothetical protein